MRQPIEAPESLAEAGRRGVPELYELLPAPVLVESPEAGIALGANDAFRRLVDRTAEEIEGAQRPYPWQPDPDAAVLVRPDGSEVTVAIATNLLDDGRAVSVVTDLTDAIRLDQQLAQSGKLAAIGELAAGVAHEINNPLFAILGLTEFLLKEAEPGSRAHERLELIQQTGLEIKEIVRALLDFARENADERLVVPLEDVVRATVDLVRRTNAHKGVRLVDSYDGAETLVDASPNQLKQVLLNLIGNARQAMPNGGEIRVDVRRDGDHAIAVVSDDGPGIPARSLPRIFEPFYTTKRHDGGTGLGLSVGLGIAESHGGSLTVVSEPGEGATFTLRLPIVS